MRQDAFMRDRKFSFFILFWCPSYTVPVPFRRIVSYRTNDSDSIRLLLGLEVVEQDGALLRLLTPVLDNDARAVDNLAGVALAVENAYGMLVGVS